MDIIEYLLKEVQLRAILVDDPATETIIVRRGDGTRQVMGVDINEGEVLGKIGGELKSMPARPLPIEIVIEPGLSGVVDMYPISPMLSKKWVIDFYSYDIGESQHLEMSVEVMAKLWKDNIGFTVYAILGDTLDVPISVTVENMDVILRVTNNLTHNLTVRSQELR